MIDPMQRHRHPSNALIPRSSNERTRVPRGTAAVASAAATMAVAVAAAETVAHLLEVAAAAAAREVEGVVVLAVLELRMEIVAVVEMVADRAVVMVP